MGASTETKTVASAAPVEAMEYVRSCPYDKHASRRSPSANGCEPKRAERYMSRIAVTRGRRSTLAAPPSVQPLGMAVEMFMRSSTRAQLDGQASPPRGAPS